MTLGELAPIVIAAREAEHAAGNKDCDLDGVAVLQHGQPLPEDIKWLGDLQAFVVDLHEHSDFVGFFYRGLASRPAFIGGYTDTEVDWEIFRPPGSDDQPHNPFCVAGTYYERGAAGEVQLLGHLLAVAAGIDPVVSQSVLKGGAV